MFQLNQVSFSIPHRTLLQPTSLNFEAGYVYGLIGHNGSGKSTLIKLMARQQPISGGDILLDNRSIQDWQSREFAKRVAYLPQHLPQATNMTAKELIAMGRYAWNGLFGRETEADKQAIAHALKLTHTEKFADQLVDTLSGGERSRIWLAMLLAQESIGYCPSGGSDAAGLSTQPRAESWRDYRDSRHQPRFAFLRSFGGVAQWQIVGARQCAQHREHAVIATNLWH